MSDASRVEALKKMEGFKVKIGYPDKFIDYGALPVLAAPAGAGGGGCGGGGAPQGPGAHHLRNVFAGRAFAMALDLARTNAPTDRGRCQTARSRPLSRPLPI